MSQSLSHVRHGVGAVRPYLYGPLGLPDFVRDVFGAVELERHVFNPQNQHVELQVADAVLVIEAGERPSGAPWPTAAVYVYVPDVDAVHARALRLGAVSVAAPVDKPYQERQCGFNDAGGNLWWVSTFKA
jgi:PhnB protein